MLGDVFERFVQKSPISVMVRACLERVLGADRLDLWYERTAQKQLSLSRLNHRLPRYEAHPEVVQGTAQFHHEITDTVLPQPNPVFDDTAALDAAIDMLDPQ